ncbi:hypothetical protein [Granulicella mallensis]|uniref:Uncharacterized protein n=1 Tax=Granulicella mallensis (strain ATCC BAA-1857 / DSM 23137 / MP5ACTX8) TaxID=682795 RepID=G8NZY3_GRAMM|nr:hypothetical protein [Granulicella mallensis]AEU35699.1 hypothetical protein AciX8_1356 [Granulicella mallensis MP5ACTX8]
MKRHLKTSLLRWVWLVSLLLLGIAAQSFGQGCSQCLDNTRATPPAVQAAYRKAIYLLGGTGAALFIAGTLFIRRER